eukprot:Em0143g4a
MLKKALRYPKRWRQQSTVLRIYSLRQPLSRDASTVAPFVVSVQVDEKYLNMEVDTGALVSLISERTWQDLCTPKLNPAKVILRSYSGESVKVLGVTVQYQDQKKKLNLLVVTGGGTSHLGCDWLQHLKLNWCELNHLQSAARLKLEDVLKKHADVFKEELGKFSFQFSEWAAPIVPVCKPNGSLRICGDYKVTVNKYAKTEEYPLPRIEDLVAALWGGQEFTKLDLANAYLQLPLEDKSMHRNAVKGGKVSLSAGEGRIPGTMAKVGAIKEAPAPKDEQQLRSFLGLLNYYGKFLPNLSTKLAPLHSLLEKGKGKDNANADVLSRLPLPEYPMEVTLPGVTVMLLETLQSSPVNAKQIAEWMAKDPVLSKVKKWLSQGWTNTDEHREALRPYRQHKEELSLQDGCILWGSRVVVPEQGWKLVIEELHAEHQGISRMKSLGRSFVWWSNMDADVEECVKRCEQPSKDEGIFASHGLPVTLVSDDGSAFTSQEFEEFLTKNGVSPAELLMGRRLRSHLSMIHPGVKEIGEATQELVQEKVRATQERQKKWLDKRAKPRSFFIGIKVWIKKRKPKSSMEAGQYLEARNQTNEGSLPLRDQTPRSRAPEVQKGPPNDYGKHYRNLLKNGWVLSKRVTNVDLDTGCLKILIYQKLVPKEKFIQNEAVTIRRTHGDNVLHPVTKLNLVVDGIPLSVEVGVSPTLPVSVLLGTDVLKLSKWLRGSRDRSKGKDCHAGTQAGDRHMEEEERKQVEREKATPVWPTEEEDTEDKWSCRVCLDEDLFAGGWRGLEEVQCSPNLTAIKELKGGKPCRGLRYFTPFAPPAKLSLSGSCIVKAIYIHTSKPLSTKLVPVLAVHERLASTSSVVREILKNAQVKQSEIVELDPNKVEAGKSSLYQRPRRLPVRMATRFKECEDAFLSLKVILCGSPALRSPEYEKEFIPQGLPFGKSIYVTNGSQVDRLKDENPRLHHAGARLSALRVQVTFIKENGESVMNQVYDITHDILTGSYCDV